MIQSALDEDFHTFIGTKISGIQRIYNILKSRQKPEMGNVVKTRIEGAIHPMQMLLQLCRFVISKEKLNRYGSATTSDTPTTPSEFIASGSLFEDNKTAFEDLKKAFTDLYLEDFRQLEGIRKEQAPNTAWSHLKAKYRKIERRVKRRNAFCEIPCNYLGNNWNNRSSGIRFIHFIATRYQRKTQYQSVIETTNSSTRWLELALAITLYFFAASMFKEVLAVLMKRSTNTDISRS